MKPDNDCTQSSLGKLLNPSGLIWSQIAQVLTLILAVQSLVRCSIFLCLSFLPSSESTYFGYYED
jgi:hypothetical protein